jgi:hypothetical protein
MAQAHSTAPPPLHRSPRRRRRSRRRSPECPDCPFRSLGAEMCRRVCRTSHERNAVSRTREGPDRRGLGAKGRRRRDAV